MRGKLGRILAWVVTLGLLAYVFSSTSLSDLAQATRSAAGWSIPVFAGLVLVVYVADSFAIWKTFGWFVAPLSFREVMTVRGASYVVAVVNYALGQGAMVYFMNRSRGVPILRTTGAVLLIMGINLLLLLVMATVGLASGVAVPTVIRVVVPVAWVGLGFYVVLQIAKPRFLRSRAVLDVLLGAGFLDHLKALAVRLPHVMTLVFFTYTSLHAFGVAVPFWYALVCLPAVFFIAALPISVLGLGTTQVAMQFFFARYAPGDQRLQHATIIAASLLSQVVALAGQATIGLVCMRSHLGRELARAPGPAAASGTV